MADMPLPIRILRSWRSWSAAVGATAFGIGLYRFDNWYEAMDSSWTKSCLDTFEILLMGPGMGLLAWLLAERARHKDDHHRRRLEQEQEQRFAQLGRIAASVAHEVRNPLHNLRLIGGELRAESAATAASPVGELLGRLDANLIRLDHTVRLAYELARPARPLEDADAADLDLPGLLEAVIADTLRHLTRACAIAHLRPAGRVLVRAREPALRIILGNLVRNAVEAGGGGPLRIGYQRGEGEWTLLLANPGALPPGLAAGAHQPPSTKPDGLGVGLGICRHLLTGLGGNLAFTQEAGMVTASVTLPAATPMMNAAAP